MKVKQYATLAAKPITLKIKMADVYAMYRFLCRGVVESSAEHMDSHVIISWVVANGRIFLMRYLISLQIFVGIDSVKSNSNPSVSKPKLYLFEGLKNCHSSYVSAFMLHNDQLYRIEINVDIIFLIQLILFDFDFDNDIITHKRTNNFLAWNFLICCKLQGYGKIL